MKGLTLVLLALAVACGGETPAPKLARTPERDAGPPVRAPAHATCSTLVVLAALPETPPASRCATPSPAPAVPPKDAIGRELAELAAAPADAFAARRAKLLARGAGALRRLRELAAEAPTARERGLSAALVTRLEKPGDAKQLDGWAPPKHALMLRNPFPAVRRSLEAAYAPYPELAYEALARARDDQDQAPPHATLVSVADSPLFGIVARGPEAFERLADLAPRFPAAFALLVELDPERGSCAALSWLDGKLPDASDERGRGVLSTLRSDDPLARYLLKKALRDGPPELELVAGSALARQKDASIAPDLLANLADQKLAGDARAQLVTLLGAEEAEKRLAELSRECRAEHRLGAARALRFSPASSASELLARLAGDAEAGVRAEALDSLAWLSLTRPGSALTFSDAVELAVLAAAGDSDPNVRRLALNALWRLVVEKRRPLDDAMRSTWARALSDPDRRAQTIALVELDDFFPSDWELVLVLLGDLGRVPDEWPHREAVGRARQKLGKPTRERVSELGRGSVPELRAIAEAWLARK